MRRLGRAVECHRAQGAVTNATAAVSNALDAVLAASDTGITEDASRVENAASDLAAELAATALGRAGGQAVGSVTAPRESGTPVSKSTIP
ncbi:MAG: hypothetical protein LBC97_08025 [Bifidobacteriaceae bacterium]|nr:hypothetical protein [Bifidobacteriaceae bacterium]